jgi:6-phosphofructokinase 2
VLSGSLPPDAPGDIYARFARLRRLRETCVVLDTSGPALAAALDAGVYLVKPSLGELQALSGRSLADEGEWWAAAQSLVRAGHAQVVALTLGRNGALLATADKALRLPGLTVPVASAAGAGDSFVAGLIWALNWDVPLEQAVRYGLAAASAALLSEGTGLCEPSAVHCLYQQISAGP